MAQCWGIRLFFLSKYTAQTVIHVCVFTCIYKYLYMYMLRDIPFREAPLLTPRLFSGDAFFILTHTQTNYM